MSREYPNQPLIGVGAVVFKGEEVLLIKRGKPPRKGEWSLPGGAQALGETYREAVLREVKEETTIDMEVLKVVDVVDSIVRDDKGQIQYHYTLIDVVGQWRSGIPTPRDDADDAKWFRMAEISAVGLWSETSRIIEEAWKIKKEHEKNNNS